MFLLCVVVLLLRRLLCILQFRNLPTTCTFFSFLGSWNLEMESVSDEGLGLPGHLSSSHSAPAIILISNAT